MWGYYFVPAFVPPNPEGKVSIRFSFKDPQEMGEHFKGMAQAERDKQGALRKASDKDKAAIRAEAFDECAAVAENTTIED